MEKLDVLSPAEAGGNNSSVSTEKSVLSPEVESKWRQFRDYDTDSAWVRSCMINDPESWGKIKRYYMLQKALFGSTESMDRAYKSFVDNQISGFTDMDRNRMAMICARAKVSMPFTDVEVAASTVIGDVLYSILGDSSPEIEKVWRECWGSMIICSTSRPQTIYGYKETPIVIVPSLENVWDLLVLVHEFVHATHLRISSQNNEIGRFVPDEMVAETIANSFQFAALKYIADKWGNDIANHMWDMLLSFGLDDNVHYSKKKATLLGLVSMPYQNKGDFSKLFDVLKSGNVCPSADLYLLTGCSLPGNGIEAGLKIAESKKVF